jgi:hypothetical protein
MGNANILKYYNEIFHASCTDSYTNSCINMLPDKLSGSKTVVPDNYLFVLDNVRDRPLIFRLAWFNLNARFGG